MATDILSQPIARERLSVAIEATAQIAEISQTVRKLVIMPEALAEDGAAVHGLMLRIEQLAEVVSGVLDEGWDTPTAARRGAAHGVKG